MNTLPGSSSVNGPLILFIHGWPGTAITWKTQLDAFASVGFRAIAPDMPRYGKSTARRIFDDYPQEAIVEAKIALLADTRHDAAIWVGHDWGAGNTLNVGRPWSSSVYHSALLSMAGKDSCLWWRGRSTPRGVALGQWEYMRKYEKGFEQTVEWIGKDIEGFRKAGLQPTTPPRPVSIPKCG